MPARGNLVQRVGVAERFRHLLAFHEKMLDVHPEARERAAPGAFALGNLVLVMWKYQIDAAGMNVDRRFAEKPQRHGRAFDVPSRTAGAGPVIP